MQEATPIALSFHVEPTTYPMLFHTDPTIEQAERALLAGYPSERQDTRRMRKATELRLRRQFPDDLAIYLHDLVKVADTYIKSVRFETLGGGKLDLLPSRPTVYIGVHPERRDEFLFKSGEVAELIKNYLRGHGCDCRIQMSIDDTVIWTHLTRENDLPPRLQELMTLPLLFHTDPIIEKAERELIAGHPANRQDVCEMKLSCPYAGWPADLAVQVAKNLPSMAEYGARSVSVFAFGGGKNDLLPQRVTVLIGFHPGKETKFLYRAEEVVDRTKQFLRQRDYSCRIWIYTDTDTAILFGS